MTTATVTNTVVLPDSTTPTNVYVRIQLIGSTGLPLTSAFVTSTGSVVAGMTEINSTNGQWSAVLQLNSGTNLTPSGTAYQVTQVVYNTAAHPITYIDYITVSASGTMASMLTTPPASLVPSGALAPGDQGIDVARQYGSDLKAAIAARGNNVDYLLTPGVYTISSLTDLPTNGQVIGAGSGAVTINVVGAITGLRYRPQDTTSRGKISGVTIVGTSAAGAVGLQVSDCFSFKLNDVVIRDFTAGVGLLTHNITSWTEATELDGVNIRNCATSWQMKRTASSGGTNSLGHTRCWSLSMNVPANGIGIDTSGDPVYIYHSVLCINFWLGANATAIRLNNTSDNFLDNAVTLFGENQSGATGTVGINCAGQFIGEGVCQINANTATTGTGVVRVFAPIPIDTVSGTSGGNVYRAVFSENPGAGYTASLGFRTGTNISDVYAGIYNFVGNKFAVRRVDFGSSASAGTEVFYVDVAGNVVFQNGAAIRGSGTGNPNGVVVGNPGDLYLNTAGGAGTTLWVKESGAGTSTGWVGK